MITNYYKHNYIIDIQRFDGELEKPSLIDHSYAGYLAGSHDPTNHHVSVDTKQLEFDNQSSESHTVSVYGVTDMMMLTVLLGQYH